MDLCFLPERQLLFAAQDLQEMKDCNQITAEYGLQLPPPEDAGALYKAHGGA